MIRLYFYTYSQEKQFHTLNANEASHQPWIGLRDKICEIASKSHNDFINISDSSIDHKPEESIIILFLQAVYLSSKHHFFDAIGQSKNNPLRPTTKPKNRRDAEKPFYYPVITISMPDIMGLYTESLEREFHTPDKKYLLDLQPDKRFKFLDSSIWHRYVPILPSRGSFEEYFGSVFNEMAGYWSDGLYYTHAAIATLEFQVRMLRHSFIAKTGDRGHDEHVTPFKFHSESWMRQIAEEEVKFFTDPVWVGGSLIQQLKWRVLIIDDQAKGKPVSSKNNKCRVEKEYLILKPFSDLYTKFNLNSTDHVTVKVPHDGGSHDDLVRASLECLRQANYDIIFLDYLLGRHRQGWRREYGYEVILNLIDENRATNSFGLPPVRRDFQGRHWIFQISSFPFAFSDKLNQLGLSHLHEIWHLGNGGDPITSPHLYAYYLYRFMKQKVGQYFLYPELLERIFREVPVDISQNKNQKRWATFLFEALVNRRKQDKLLEDHTFDNNTSLFLKSAREFIRNQKSLNQTLFQVHEILDYLLLDNIDISISEFKAICTKIVNNGGNYKEALEIFTSIATKLAADNFNKAENAIQNAMENSTNLDLSGLNLTEIPKEISRLTALETLNLSGNQLTEFPYIIFDLKNLKNIDLNGNNLHRLPPAKAFQQLSNLVEFNNDKNSNFPIGKILGNNNKDFMHSLNFTFNKLEQGKRANIFIAYSSDDAIHREVFVKKLETYKKLHNFNIFYDNKTNMGALWDEEVKKQINLADIIILLCSDSILCSPYFRNKELPWVLKRHFNVKTPIFPVLLQPCDWRSVLGLDQLNALPNDEYEYPYIEGYFTNGKLHEGWYNVVLDVVGHLPPIKAKTNT